MFVKMKEDREFYQDGYQRRLLPKGKVVEVPDWYGERLIKAERATKAQKPTEKPKAKSKDDE